MLFVLWVPIFLTCAIFLVIRYHWSRRHLYAAARKYVGPVPLPIVGNGLLFYCKTEDSLMRISSGIDQYDEPFRFWLGPRLILVFKDPNHLEVLFLYSLTYVLQRSSLGLLLDLELDVGVIPTVELPFEYARLSSGPKYRHHRRFIQPLFDLHFCIGAIETLQKNAIAGIKELEKFVDAGTFDIFQSIRKTMINACGETILGCNSDDQKCYQCHPFRDLSMLYRITIERLFRAWLHPDVIFNMTKRSRDLRKLSEITDKFLGKSEDPMTNQIAFLCVCLGINREYQEKAAQEIREVLGETPKAITYDQICKLTYMDMCIKDALRLVPIAPLIMRSPIEDIMVDDYLIPKGCGLLIPIYCIHRDPKYWERPNSFYPNHFLPEAVSKRPNYAYIPFSAGPRGCIGKIFARIGMKIVLASILQRFEIEADGRVEDIKVYMEITGRVFGGFNVRLKNRTWKQI